MRKIFAASALGLLLLAGCATVDSGTIVDKVREPGSTEIKCTGTGTKKKCKTDTDPEKCMFQLDNGKDEGWLEVDCLTEFAAFEVGQVYPRGN